MAGRRLLKLVRSKSLLFNLFQAGFRLLRPIRVIHRNLQPCPGRSPHNQHCPGQRLAAGLRLFNFVRAGRHQIKLVRTGRRLLSLVRAGRRLLNLVWVAQRLLTRTGRCLHILV